MFRVCFRIELLSSSFYPHFSVSGFGRLRPGTTKTRRSSDKPVRRHGSISPRHGWCTSSPARGRSRSA